MKRENEHPNLLGYGFKETLLPENYVCSSHEPYRYLNRCYAELQDFGQDLDYERYCPKQEEELILCHKIYDRNGFVKEKNLSKEDLKLIGYYKLVEPTISPCYFKLKQPYIKGKVMHYMIQYPFFLGGIELLCKKLNILHTSTIEAVNYRECLLDLLPKYIDAAPKDRDPTIFCKKLYKNKPVTRYIVDKRLKNIIATEYFLQRKDCDTSYMQPSHEFHYADKRKQEYTMLRDFRAEIILDEGEYILCPVPYYDIDQCKVLLEAIKSNKFHFFIKFSYELYPLGKKFQNHKLYLEPDYADSELSERDLDILQKELMEEVNQDSFDKKKETYNFKEISKQTKKMDSILPIREKPVVYENLRSIKNKRT